MGPEIVLVLTALQSAGTPAATPIGRDASSDYEVRYHHTLTNVTRLPLENVRVYLPVPVSDEAQEILDFRVELQGKPYRVSRRTDAYGNCIERVMIPKLEPGEEAAVGFACVARLKPSIRQSLDAKGRGSLDEIPKDVRDKYTIDHAIFGLASPTVERIASDLLKRYPSPIARAIAVHDLVAGTFKYRAGDGWDPAPEVLERRSGSCSEFAYAFCALCRATGIPTRFAGGSICPLDAKLPFEDLGWHRWAEAYLPGHGWVPFDPTLDRATPPRRDFVGARHPRVLVLTRTGTKSRELGLSYIGANSHAGQTRRRRWFTWTPSAHSAPGAR